MLRTTSALCVIPHKERALCVCHMRMAAQCMLCLAETTEPVLFHEQRRAVCFASRNVYKGGRGCQVAALPNPQN